MKETLLTKIDLSKSRLKPYQGFVFLCGGPTNAQSHKPISIRDAIFRELVKDDTVEPRIRIAEDYKDWSHDSVYRDLVSFERHLAELSSVIVLALESPGSIAELGLFSTIDEFKKKLLVFIETDHYKVDSFIRLGPIDYLEKVHNNTVQCHRWTTGASPVAVFDPIAAEALQSDLAEAVRSRASSPTPERPIDTTRWLDCALLLCDLLNLCSALTIREIRTLLSGVGFERTESEIRQKLFLLERVGLLAMEPKGDQRFYICVEDREHVHLSYRDGTFDAIRFRVDLLHHYEQEDKKRYRAILEARKKHAISS
jgi:hypothetical protein